MAGRTVAAAIALAHERRDEFLPPEAHLAYVALRGPEGWRRRRAVPVAEALRQTLRAVQSVARLRISAQLILNAPWELQNAWAWWRGVSGAAWVLIPGA
jgi:hypothetical protein